jgi:hypothetical protein
LPPGPREARPEDKLREAEQTGGGRPRAARATSISASAGFNPGSAPPPRWGRKTARGGEKFRSALFVILFALLAQPVLAQGGFSDWAAIVVAGDWHAHDGSPSEIFDNARRDVTRDLIALGFARENVMEFSARPGASNGPVNAQAIGNALWDLSNRTRGGCLLYFSSHGSPDGVVLGDSILQPNQLARILTNSCAGRPTVVVVSACFSGIFEPALAGANRLILTAARGDRTSFGCGQTDRYPYFDECLLSVWPRSDGFPTLGREAQNCVAAREKKEHVGPPSEPQMSIGANIESELPKWR